MIVSRLNVELSCSRHFCRWNEELWHCVYINQPWCFVLLWPIRTSAEVPICRVSVRGKRDETSLPNPLPPTIITATHLSSLHEFTVSLFLLSMLRQKMHQDLIDPSGARCSQLGRRRYTMIWTLILWFLSKHSVLNALLQATLIYFAYRGCYFSGLWDVCVVIWTVWAHEIWVGQFLCSSCILLGWCFWSYPVGVWMVNKYEYIIHFRTDTEPWTVRNCVQ